MTRAVRKPGARLRVLITGFLAFALSAAAQPTPPIVEQFTLNNAAILAAWQPIVEPARRATVQVMVDGEPVVRGTIVTPDGLCVTKASEIAGFQSLGVVLSDGAARRARLVDVDESNDLAVLAIYGNGLPTAPWAEQEAELGHWVAATGPEEMTVQVGVVSARRRAVAREGGVVGIRLEHGEAVGGVAIAHVYPDSGAEAAGLKADDVIMRIEDQATPTGPSLIQAVSQYPPGHTIRITYRRGRTISVVPVTLGDRAVVFRDMLLNPNDAVSGAFSMRRNGFTAVLQHHIPLQADECGGPLVNLDGRVIGINIARVNRSETYALPADLVRDVIHAISPESVPAAATEQAVGQ